MFNDNEFVLFSNMFKHANPTILSELTSSHSFPPLLLHPSFPLQPPSFPFILSSPPFLYSLLHPSYPLYPLLSLLSSPPFLYYSLLHPSYAPPHTSHLYSPYPILIFYFVLSRLIFFNKLFRY